MLGNVRYLVTARASRVRVLVRVNLINVCHLTNLLTSAVEDRIFLTLLNLVCIFNYNYNILRSIRTRLNARTTGCYNNDVTVSILCLSCHDRTLSSCNVTRLSFPLTITLCLTLYVSRDHDHLLLILLFLDLPLNVTFLTLLSLNGLTNGLIIQFLNIGLLSLLLRNVRFLASTANFLLLHLALSGLSSNVLGLLITLLRRFYDFLLHFLRGHLSTTLSVLSITFVFQSNLLRVLLTLVSILTLILPMSLIASSVLRMLITLSMFKACSIKYLLSRFFQRSSLSYSFSNRE